MTKALVVYESMFGNTEQVARAVADGLRQTMDVEVTPVADAPAEPPGDVGLVVAGGPTHAFSMSRASTREDAVRQGARSDAAATGLREWLAGLGTTHAAGLATFDTRVTKVRRLPGSAAKAAFREGRRHGFAAASSPMSFYVLDTPGPLADGELERAERWGAELATRLATRPATS